MRNAKDSALNPHAVKNGCNRDGNEKIRKGLSGTNRSIRMDWFKPGIMGNFGPDMHPTANKIARTEPLFPFHEDEKPNAPAFCKWEWYRFFDKRDGSLKEAREWMAGTFDAAEYESDRFWQEWGEAHTSSAMWLDLDFAPEYEPMVGI